MPNYVTICVRFNDGKRHTEVVMLGTHGKIGVSCDKAAHLVQEQQRKFWGSFKTPIGVSYQAADNLVDAFIASNLFGI